MAKRDPYSRWNRLPPVYRSGEHRIPGPEDEPQRIVLYLKGRLLDLAEALAEKTGFATLQDYCADLLSQAIEIERVKHHVADLEARQGTLEGFQAISDDASYLAEWQQKSESRDSAEGHDEPESPRAERPIPEVVIPGDILEAVALPEKPTEELTPALPRPETETEEAPRVVSIPQRTTIRVSVIRPTGSPTLLERMVPEVLDGSAIAALWSHVGPGHDLPDGFLPSLRRGQDVPPARVADLLDALGRIEADQRGATMIERRLSYALHRLSLESQVLLTEAWPGVFDERTLAAIRAIQERVERILAGTPSRDEESGEAAAECPS